MLICKIIIKDEFYDQEAPEAQLAAHAPWRTSARGGFGAARLAAILAGESPANRGVQSLL